MSVDRIPPAISEHSSLKDFLLLKSSRDEKGQRGYWHPDNQIYALVGWTQEGEPIFVDNGQAAKIWDGSAYDNTGKLVRSRIYWRADHSAGGAQGTMLPPFVKINSKNMWLEIDSAIPIEYVRKAFGVRV